MPPWCLARGPARCFWEITLPTIWPSLLGAFLISFILAFNNLEISFYNLGAIPTLAIGRLGLSALWPRTRNFLRWPH